MHMIQGKTYLYKLYIQADNIDPMIRLYKQIQLIIYNRLHYYLVRFVSFNLYSWKIVFLVYIVYILISFVSIV